MYYIDYQTITENFFNNIQNIVFDIDNWVWLDYKVKKVTYRRLYPSGTQTRPATIAEYIAFMTHFYSKGVKECWFRELKQYVNFNGHTYRGRKYYCVLELDYSDFYDLLHSHRNIMDYFYTIRNTFNRNLNHKNKPVKEQRNIIDRKSISDFLITIAKFLENDSKAAE